MSVNNSEIHVGDVGTSISVTLIDENGNPVDISSATQLNLLFEKPKTGQTNENEVIKMATLVNSGTDGKFHYVSENGFFDVPGNYLMQGQIVFSGSTYSTNIVRLQVRPNLGAANYI